MQFPQALQTANSVNESIKQIDDLSDQFMRRARVLFNNDYELSIIQGPYSYGGPAGLYEIAIINPAGSFCPELFEDDENDDVLGWQTEKDIMHYIQKIGSIQ